MLIADCRIKLDKIGQDVVKRNVTPAEAAFLVAEHNARAGGQPLEVLGEPKDVTRSSIDEINRLYSLYPAKKIKALFSNAMSRVPETFEEAIAVGMGTPLPAGKLMEFAV